MRIAMATIVFCGLAVMAQAQSPAPTIEEVEAQIKEAEEKVAVEQAKRKAGAALKADAERQARVKREAAAAATAQQAILLIRSDAECNLSINGQAQGVLAVGETRSVRVSPGDQIVDCVSTTDSGLAVNEIRNALSGTQTVVHLVLPHSKERFESVTEGIRDNQQNLIWAQADNGSDINWIKASSFCAALGAGWTLPTSAALQSLFSSGKDPKISTSGCCFWSSEKNGPSEAWSVFWFDGIRYAHPVGYDFDERALCVQRL